MFHVRGCDKCTEPDCVPYKALCFAVELTCSLVICCLVVFPEQWNIYRNGAARLALSFPASSQLFRQLFGATCRQVVGSCAHETPLPRPNPLVYLHRLRREGFRHKVHIASIPPVCTFRVLSSHQQLITIVFPSSHEQNQPPGTPPPHRIFCRHMTSTTHHAL